MRVRLLILLMPIFLFSADVKLQVLGSGGPELDERASASYLIWIDKKAKILVDFGGGAFLRLGQAKAELKDIDLILITHFHIDHVADFPALAKAGYFSDRKAPIALFGPSGNRHFPDTQKFLNEQFENGKIYGYMSEVLDQGNDGISFVPYVFESDPHLHSVRKTIKGCTVDIIGVNHGSVPALAYRVEIDGKSITFSGDTSAKSDNLILLAKNTDLFVAHHAIAQDSGSVAKELHMTPRRIGELAAGAHAKKLLLGHRMQRTKNREGESIAEIQKKYQGPILFAEDLLIVPLGNN